MSTVDITADDMAGSLNGFEELAIKKAFSVNLNALNDDSAQLLRALIFADKRRGEGVADKTAYKAAMDLPLREVQAYFAEPEPEADPDDPDTDQGKDG